MLLTIHHASQRLSSKLRFPVRDKRQKKRKKEKDVDRCCGYTKTISFFSTSIKKGGTYGFKVKCFTGFPFRGWSKTKRNGMKQGHSGHNYQQTEIKCIQTSKLRSKSTGMRRKRCSPFSKSEVYAQTMSLSFSNTVWYVKISVSSWVELISVRCSCHSTKRTRGRLNYVLLFLCKVNHSKSKEARPERQPHDYLWQETIHFSPGAIVILLKPREQRKQQGWLMLSTRIRLFTIQPHYTLLWGKGKTESGGKKTPQEDSHDLNSIASDQNVWKQSHCLWQTECEWNQACLTAHHSKKLVTVRGEKFILLWSPHAEEFVESCQSNAKQTYWKDPMSESCRIVTSSLA